MSVSLVCTGIQFPDSTIQTTAASPLSTVLYDDRGTLRTTTPSANLTSIAVQDLGIFTYYANNTEPDDDDTCFVVSGSGGAWRMAAPSMEFIENWQLPDWEMALAGRQTGFVCFCQGVSTIAAGASVIVAACIPGATPGDVVMATPINWKSSGLCSCVTPPYVAIIPCNDCLWLYLNNFNTSSCQCITCGGGVVIFKCGSGAYCGANTIWKAASFQTAL